MAASVSRLSTVTFGSVVVEGDPRELLEHLDTPSLIKPFLEGAPEDNRTLYLECVDELQESIDYLEKIPQLECCVKELHDGREIMKTAVDKLLPDFRTLLASNSLRLQKEPHMRLLISHSRKLAQQVLTASKSGEDAEIALRGSKDPLPPGFPELMQPHGVETIAGVAKRLAAAGDGSKCCKSYLEERRSWQKSMVEDMGMLALFAEDVTSVKWEKLEDMIAVWNDQLRMLTALAVLEESLAAAALKSVDEAEQSSTVAELAMHWLRPLVAIGRAVADSKRSPEKMVPLLDMTESLTEARIVFQQFSEAGPESPAALVTGLLESVREAILETAEEFQRLVQKDEATGDQQQQQKEQEGAAEATTQTAGGTGGVVLKGHRRFPFFKHGRAKNMEDSVDLPKMLQSAPPAAAGNDGDVEKVASYVMNFMVFLMNKDLNYVTLLEPIMGSLTAVAEWLNSMMKTLRANLDGKASQLNDDKLQELFLMNNKSYIIDKLERENPGARELLGKKWCDSIKEEVDQHRNNFLTLAVRPFEMILSPDQGRDMNLFYSRVKAFNAALNDLCGKQRVWTVRNKDLRAYIKSQETNNISSRYKDFLDMFREYTEGSRSGKLKPLSVADVEQKISEGFPEKKKT